MPDTSQLQEDLINRYTNPGPHYISYPPPTRFDERISESDYRDWARNSNEELIPKPLSLYFQIPFCSSIRPDYSCGKHVNASMAKSQAYLQDLYREIEIQSRLFDRDREVRQMSWGGGVPGFLTHGQSRQLMDKIARHFRLVRDDKAEYSIEVDPRLVGIGGAAHLRGLGFNRISITIHEFDTAARNSEIGIQNPETTAAVVRDARRQGFRSVAIDLVYGLPSQSGKGFASTLDKIIELDPDRIALHNHAFRPFRAAGRQFASSGERPDPRGKLAMLHQAITRLAAAGYHHIGMDHFVKPGDELSVAQRNGSLHRNFQGYTAHAQCDSIGFGVSAYSQVGDNFSQNATSLESYHDRLDHAQLPVIRGYQSDDDDLLRRDIIQSLLCQFRLDPAAIGRKWEIDFAEYFSDELAQLEKLERDGLVRISDSEIAVSEAGRLLVRGICMIFDRYQRMENVSGLDSQSD